MSRSKTLSHHRLPHQTPERRCPCPVPVQSGRGSPTCGHRAVWPAGGAYAEGPHRGRRPGCGRTPFGSLPAPEPGSWPHESLQLDLEASAKSPPSWGADPRNGEGFKPLWPRVLGLSVQSCPVPRSWGPRSHCYLKTEATFPFLTWVSKFRPLLPARDPHYACVPAPPCAHSY